MEEGKEKNVEVRLPLILIKSRRFLSLYDRLAEMRATGVAGWVMLVLLPVITAGGIYLLLSSITVLLSRPEVQEAQREAGPGILLLIPGVNPYLPIVYGWIGIVVAIIVHEAAHGVIARRMGYAVKSSGLLLFLGVPIGAFVEIDENELRRGRGRDAIKTLAAGPVANLAVAVIALLALISIISGLTPLVNIGVVEVMPGSPAERAGIQGGDMIMAIDGVKVLTYDELSKSLEDKKMGDRVRLSIARGPALRERLDVEVGLEDLGAGRPMMGVRLGEIRSVEYLDSYKSLMLSLSPDSIMMHFVPPSLNIPGAITHPYSERVSWLFTHPLLGDNFPIFTSLLYWVWFVNINVSIFNALPIYPLDGGQALRRFVSAMIGGRSGESAARYAAISVSLLFIALIAALVAIPYLPG